MKDPELMHLVTVAKRNAYVVVEATIAVAQFIPDRVWQLINRLLLLEELDVVTTDDWLYLKKGDKV